MLGHRLLGVGGGHLERGPQRCRQSGPLASHPCRDWRSDGFHLRHQARSRARDRRIAGVIGFPIAALLLSVALGGNESWRSVRRALLWIANLSWISVVLLIVTMAVMITQLAHATGGHLPQHAPKTLPPGVLALDGWANRLIVLSNCAWVLLAAMHAIRIRPKEDLS